MANISKDTPLAELTLRRYEKPANLNKRQLIRKLCLSLGLLQPGDSRDVIVDVFHVLLKSKKELDSEEIKRQVIELREKESLPLKGIASSNIRRQLKRLRDIYLIEKITNNYRVTELDKISVIFQEKIEKFLLPSIMARVKEHISMIDEEFK